MALQLSIGPLPRGLAAQALPLVRSLRPDLTLEEWQSYLDLVDVGGPDDEDDPALSGVTIVQDASGYLHGLFTYAVAEDIIHGRALQVENVVAVDMLGRDDASRLMVTEMERLAALHNCGAVHVTIADERATPPRSVSTLMGRLLATGHAVDGIRLCRTLKARAGRMVGAGE